MIEVQPKRLSITMEEIRRLAKSNKCTLEMFVTPDGSVSVILHKDGLKRIDSVPSGEIERSTKDLVGHCIRKLF